MTAPSAGSLVVGVGVGEYEHLARLERAVSDVEEVTARLGRDGFDALATTHKPRDAVVRGLLSALPRGKLERPGTVLAVLWSGHAGPSAEMDFAAPVHEREPLG